MSCVSSPKPPGDRIEARRTTASLVVYGTDPRRAAPTNTGATSSYHAESLAASFLCGLRKSIKERNISGSITAISSSRRCNYDAGTDGVSSAATKGCRCPLLLAHKDRIGNTRCRQGNMVGRIHSPVAKAHVAVSLERYANSHLLRTRTSAAIQCPTERSFLPPLLLPPPPSLLLLPYFSSTLRHRALLVLLLYQARLAPTALR
ncbi:hypothetical protein BHE74_00031993 [Ensete ventricosum]|nr:hypothetical protein BHE74_00031993 [Ensete ventricosum]